MATTSPDNIRTPDPGDAYNLVPDLANMANDTQLALNRRANSFTGTFVERDAFITAPVGAIWTVTDTAPGTIFQNVCTAPGVWSLLHWSGPISAIFTPGAGKTLLDGHFLKTGNIAMFSLRIGPGSTGGGDILGQFSPGTIQPPNFLSYTAMDFAGASGLAVLNPSGEVASYFSTSEPIFLQGVIHSTV